ncbi:MAG: putative membrane protein, partial [Pseudohongiellaceae bacterium]
VIVVAFMTLGAAVFLIGLAVTLPVLGHATWHLYRKLIVA